MPRRLAAAVLGALLIVTAGPPAAGAATVYAAASLRDAFPRIDPDARFSFAGSNQLQRQIERGAPADVFASASPAEPRELRRKGLCDAPRTFATNTLVMIVPAANRARVRSVYELRRGNLRVAIGTAAVPVGAYTRQVLRRLGLTSALRANSVSEEPSVQGISAKVALGSADVGFVYATDARIVRDRTDALRLPASAQPPVRYALCVVRRRGADRAGARAFVRGVLSDRGRRLLRAAGFGLPSRSTGT